MIDGQNMLVCKFYLRQTKFKPVYLVPLFKKACFRLGRVEEEILSELSHLDPPGIINVVIILSTVIAGGELINWQIPENLDNQI